MAGRGLGMLVESGYLDDFALMFCPTSQGSKIPVLGEHLNKASSLRQVGGSSREAFLYGNYTSTPSWTWGAEAGRSWIGSYTYRNNLLMRAWPDWKYYSTPSYPNGYSSYGTTQPISPYVIDFTKPAVSHDDGCPMFKTPKLLGGRALISDSWLRNLNAGTGSGLTAEAGWSSSSTFSPIQIQMSNCADAYGGHGRGEGFNVMFGDSHASWYGDPQNRILWWPIKAHTGNWNYLDDPYAQWVASTSGTGGTTGVYTGFSESIYMITSGSKCKPAFAVWHQFDVASGIDAP